MAGIRIASAAYSVAVIRIVPAGFSRSSLRAPSSTSISSNLGPIFSSSRSPAWVGVTLCGLKMMREEMQDRLGRLNADWLDLDAANAPDGDADPEVRDFTSFSIPPCQQCGGLLKPYVVFFGETVPRGVVEAAAGHLQQADAMLVVGSSLMVYSGFRFVQMATRGGIPIAAVNLGRTRADEMLALKVEETCESALSFLL